MKHTYYRTLAVSAALFTAATITTTTFAQDDVNQATFNNDGSVQQPVGWRKWVFVGAPLTPNALNGGNAPFPEYHNVYVEPSAFAAYEATGKWPEGTQIAKELTTVYENNNDEVGASSEVSGRGFQPTPVMKPALRMTLFSHNSIRF